jgi:hypothetical protein
MKYKTVVYSTVRAEIHHDMEFSSKADALEWIMGQELLDYTSILGASSINGDLRVTEVEVIDDDVTEYDTEPEERYADE